MTLRPPTNAIMNRHRNRKIKFECTSHFLKIVDNIVGSGSLIFTLYREIRQGDFDNLQGVGPYRPIT